MSETSGDPAGAVTTDWLGGGQQRSWRAFVLGSALLMERLDRELRERHGVSMSEYEILVRLSEADEQRMRMAVLADAVCQSRSRLTHTVRRMEQADLLARVTAPSDGRGVEAVLTSHGLDRLRESAPTHVAGVRAHLLELVSVDDFAAMGRVFDAVSDHLVAARPAAEMR